MTPTSSAYEALTQSFLRMYRLEHLSSLASWDQATKMPPGGNQARTEAMAELSGMLHRMGTDPQLGAQMGTAQQEDLSELQRANLREMRRRWLDATALPEQLVQRRVMATSRCEHAWRSQRPANDWAGFAENLREVLAVTREEAQRLSDQLGLSPYDALMSRFEPGMRSERVSEVFAELRTWLPNLIRQVVAKQAGEKVIAPTGPYDQAAQHRVCEQVMQALDFDFTAGRLDVSAHPFSGGVPEDVRLTTRYKEGDFLMSLMSTVHEAGHGRYEQNLPRAWLGQPVAQARSMAIHESQSLSFEMQLGGHPGFAQRLSPLLMEAFGRQPAFAPDNLQRLLTRVSPGLIRVEADEVTYPAHVMLRYEIERALVSGEVEVDDIPALWDEHMLALLGQDTCGNFCDGPMQDIHWPSGSFGYFPCYTLGAVYAAQWFAAMRRQMPDLDARLAHGDFSAVFDWLKAHIWEQASLWPTDELALRASGETLNPAHLRTHLTQRYLGTA